MSLLLCRQEPVKHPYYVDSLGIHLYSSQELAYVIYHHPLLVLDGFVDQHLIEFIRDDLDMGFLALKIERWLASDEDPDGALLMILQETYYYNSGELNKFRQQAAAFRSLAPLEYEKAKADYLFGQKQYGRAMAGYDKILNGPKDSQGSDAFQAKVWNNLGAAYACMFLFEKAFAAYQKSYELVKSGEVLERMYFITLFDSSLVLKERYQSIVTDEVKVYWDAEFQEAQEKAKEAESLKELGHLFQKDLVKRMAGAGQLVQKWKTEYRNML